MECYNRLKRHCPVIHDTHKVHCQQVGLCLAFGGTCKSVIKQSLQQLPEASHLVATVALSNVTLLSKSKATRSSGWDGKRDTEAIPCPCRDGLQSYPEAVSELGEVVGVDDAVEVGVEGRVIVRTAE